MKEPTNFRLLKTAELESMFVMRPYRGQGVGRALVHNFIRWVQTRGAEAITVTAYYSNEKAVSFYQGLGFKPQQLTLEKRRC